MMADSTVLKEEKIEQSSNNVASLYSPKLVDRMDAAATALDDFVATRPADYSSKYQPQIDLAMDKVLNRPGFEYNVNEDALYQQYKDRYTQLGRQAMQDTMGQAAALTGGYGSTYGQRVGQQTYDQYMTGLTDKIPELYQLAMQKYDRDYAYDKDRLAVLDAADNKDYGRWGDTMNLWQGDRGYLAGRYDTEMAQAMAAGESMYSRLATLISMGYTPTEEEMKIAGMNPNQLAALQGNLRGGGGGGGGDYYGGTDSNGKPTITNMQAALLTAQAKSQNPGITNAQAQQALTSNYNISSSNAAKAVAGSSNITIGGDFSGRKPR